MDSSKRDLGFLGEDFQYKFARELTDDKELFKDLNSVLDQNMFTDPSLKMYIGIMKEFYEKYDTVPSYDIIQTRMFELSHSDTEREFYEAVVKKIKTTSTEGSEYIRDTASKFFKQQNIIKTANEILKIAGNGDVKNYDKCVELLNNALNAGVHNDLGTGVFDNEDETLSDDYRVSIPTGIEGVDEVLQGGIGKQEVGVIIGSSSFGKTSMTTAMAGYASTYKCEQNGNEGFKVLQIVFEDRIKQIQRKHFGRITGVEAKDLGKPEYIDTVKAQLDNYPDKDMMERNLRIIRLPSGEKTAWDIERLIKRLINNGFRPDLVIVDYFECLAHRGDKNLSEWEMEGKTMRKFESMAGDMNMAFWIPTQGNRDSINSDIVTMDKAGGSLKKVQIAHIILSIARSNEDIAENKATIAILKNRAGAAGKVFNGVDFNNGTCRISTEHCDDGLESMFAFDVKRQNDRDKLAADIFKRFKDKEKR